MKRRKSKLTVFKIAFPIYAVILIALVIAALLYVNSVLSLYESEHPQRDLEEAIELLKEEAESGELWKKNGSPSMESGIFEEGKDQKALFIKKLDGEIKFSAAKWINDKECVYNVMSDGLPIAEIKLRKDGEAIQKLAIISIQKYDLVSYVPLSHTYTMTLPEDVNVGSDVVITVNGIALTEEHGEKNDKGETTFTFSQLYDMPKVTVTDTAGNNAVIKYPDSDGEIEFDNTFYTLTLPKNFFVDVNGERMNGEALEDGRLAYRIRLAKKAEVNISDLFGNKIKYTGASKIPFTYYKLMTGDGCTLLVDGTPAPESTVTVVDNPELKNFADLVPGLPKLPTYEIAILKDNANVTLKDKDGNDVAFDPAVKVQDLTSVSSGTVYDTVPEEVASQVNVLKVLEDWSLFMSCDLNFNALSKHLIKNSYQYNVAWKYNTSIDRTFTSYHGLGNPPFNEESVSNFIWLTDDCFSVDIRFVKHMIVLGKRLDDEMNERCYFVKYNGSWKLVGMKEIVENAE